MSYITRRNMHEDEAEILGPFDTLGEATDALTTGFLSYAGNALACEGHRLHKLVDACQELADTGRELQALFAMVQTHDFTKEPVLSHFEWEIHFTTTDNGRHAQEETT